MRRMAFEAMLVVAVLAFAGCDKRDVPAAAALASTSAATPEPVRPAPPKAAAGPARDAALWLAAPNPRRQVLRCLGKRLGT